MTPRTRRLPAALLASFAVAACSQRRSEVETTPQPRILGDSAAIANARPDSSRFPFTTAAAAIGRGYQCRPQC